MRVCAPSPGRSHLDGEGAVGARINADAGIAEAGRRASLRGRAGTTRARMSCPILNTPPRPAVDNQPGDPTTAAPAFVEANRSLCPQQPRPADRRHADDWPYALARMQARWKRPAALRVRRLAHFELIEPIGVGAPGRGHPPPPRSAARPFGGGKITRHGRRSGERPPFPPGVQARRQTRPRKHRPRLLLRRRPTPSLHRFRVRRGRQSPHHPGTPRPAAGRRALHYILQVAAGLATPSARRRPPRHPTVQHHHHARPAGPSSWTWASPAASNRPATSDSHPVRRDAWHLRLHFARTGPGAA